MMSGMASAARPAGNRMAQMASGAASSAAPPARNTVAKDPGRGRPKNSRHAGPDARPKPRPCHREPVEAREEGREEGGEAVKNEVDHRARRDDPPETRDSQEVGRAGVPTPFVGPPALVWLGRPGGPPHRF